MQSEDKYKEILKKENLKNTKHRNSVLEVIGQSRQPVSSEAIFLRLKEKGITISLSTVYRVLDALVEKGLVDKASVTDGNKALYEMNDMEHRHHLLCVKCRELLPVDGCPLEEYEKALEEKLGFSIKGHKLELYGYCKKCKKDE